ncbi:hypothetical protein GA0115233_106133 [Streptomyces sp. DI166]|uniref:hypothetical protein n=1 Tax=Streptomyces sp. DI166 TaxID=1839783 RepID=UPI0007F4A2B2|nr:hypothetical protein [Streptomyces sp. DI166]SBT93305.1 hypothetical protein GA0115233_106133 [Streptomyces sp. DI166]
MNQEAQRAPFPRRPDEGSAPDTSAVPPRFSRRPDEGSAPDTSAVPPRFSRRPDEGSAPDTSAVPPRFPPSAGPVGHPAPAQGFLPLPGRTPTTEAATDDGRSPPEACHTPTPDIDAAPLRRPAGDATTPARLTDGPAPPGWARRGSAPPDHGRLRPGVLCFHPAPPEGRATGTR